MKQKCEPTTKTVATMNVLGNDKNKTTTTKTPTKRAKNNEENILFEIFSYLHQECNIDNVKLWLLVRRLTTCRVRESTKQMQTKRQKAAKDVVVFCGCMRPTRF